MTVSVGEFTLDWLGYATARIEGPSGTVVYTDPGRYGVLDDYDARDGDLVLVTHDHHYDPDGIERVAREDATVLVYEAVDPVGIDRDVADPESLPHDVRRVAYGDELRVKDVDVSVVPAYNRVDGPRADEDGVVSHPEGFGCGFLFRVDGLATFWPGDSDVLDEHADLDVTVLLPSIAQSYTMDRREAADLAETLQPDLVLPIHYDTFEALEADSAAFAADVAGRGIPVVLDERETGQ